LRESPEKLVINGPARFPGERPALGMLAAARLLSHWEIVAEKEICLKQYGEAYRAYLKQVPRYFVFC
jgi:hypothetical protein